MCVFMMDMFIRTAVCTFDFDYNSIVSHSGSVLHKYAFLQEKGPQNSFILYSNNFNFLLRLPMSPDFPL